MKVCSWWLLLVYIEESILDDMYGDFEDLETGETTKGDGNGMADDDDDDDDEDGERAAGNDNDPETAKLLDKKAKLKSRFDAEYDQSKEPDSAYLDEMKKEVDLQSKVPIRCSFSTRLELHVTFSSIDPNSKTCPMTCAFSTKVTVPACTFDAN